MGKPKTINRVGIIYKLFIMKKFILPAFIIFAGVGAAFATTTGKSSKAPVVTGYRFDNSQTIKCIPTAECSTEFDLECTWNSEVLTKKISNTMCGSPLYKVH